MLKIVMTLLILGICSTKVIAQCGTVPYITHVHQPAKTVFVNEIIAPVAIPVYIPVTVFQYLPPVAAISAAPVVPVNSTVPVTTTTKPVTQAVNQNITAADIDKLVSARVDAILRARTNGNDSGPPPLIVSEELPKKTETKTTAATGDITQQVANILGQQSCINCHTAGAAPVKGNVTLFVKKANKLFFQPSVSEKQILAVLQPDASGKVSMPPNGTQQTSEALIVIKKWALKE